jgi:hypothetical protein
MEDINRNASRNAQKQQKITAVYFGEDFIEIKDNFGEVYTIKDKDYDRHIDIVQGQLLHLSNLPHKREKYYHEDN